MSNKDILEIQNNVNIIAFNRDLQEILDSLPMQYSEWNVNEKFDFIVRSMKRIHTCLFGNTQEENINSNKSPG